MSGNIIKFGRSVADDSFENGIAKSKRVIISGNLASWHDLPEDEREQLFAYIKGKELLPTIQIDLLRMMLRSKAFDVLEESIIQNIIAGVRNTLIKRELGDEFKKMAAQAEEEEKRRLSSLQVIKPRQLDHVLDTDEMLKRFEELGVDLESVKDRWEPFYWKQGYGKKFGSDYELPMPQLTEGAMQAFERGFEAETIDTVMVDDARADDGDTLRLFQPHTPKKSAQFLNHTRSINPKPLEKLLAKGRWTKKHETLMNKVVDPETAMALERFITNEAFFFDWSKSRKVRLVGVKLHTSNIASSPSQELDETIERLRDSYTTLPGLGTYTRLLHFLHFEERDLLNQFEDNMRKGDHKKGTEVFLNNFLTDGPVIAGHFRPHRSIFALVTVKSYKSLYDSLDHVSFLPIIQSDLPTTSLIAKQSSRIAA